MSRRRLSGPVPGASLRGGMTGGWSKNPSPPLRNSRRVDGDFEGRTIVLKDIERAITSERRELLRRRRILPKEAVEIRLKSGVPVKLKPTIEVRLWGQFI
jgi:hypothetical protein